MALCQGLACYVLSVVAALLMVITGGVVHLMNWWPQSVEWGLFQAEEDAVWLRYESARHDLRFYYTTWIFYLWAVMYVSQLCWILYGLELVCRKSRAGDLYHKVPVVPSAVFFLSCLASAAILGWLALWTTAQYFRFAPLVLLASAICNYVALAISVGSLKKYLPVLYGVRANRFVWEIRLLVHNGLGVAATWTTVALFYSLVVVLEDGDVLPPHSDGYVFLSLMGGYVVVWFAIDLSIAQRYVPHLLTPYAVILVTALQVLLKSGLQFNYHFIYSAVLLGVTAVLFLVRIAMAIGLTNRESGKGY